MDLDKAWLYRQGSWTELDDPAAQFPEELDNLFEKLHYNQAPRTNGVPGEHSVTNYYGPLFPREKGDPIAYPAYPYYVEVEVEGVTDHNFSSRMSPVTCNSCLSWSIMCTRRCS